MKGLFVTGTDTGVGKTALSALLLAEIRRRKINAAPIKPVQTGCCEATDARQEALGPSGSSRLTAHGSRFPCPISIIRSPWLT
jgi:dethiobiotin synthetase